MTFEPVKPDCPLACLRLTAKTMGLLHRLDSELATVQGLLDLIGDAPVTDLSYIGPWAARDIESALVHAGYSVRPSAIEHSHAPRPPSRTQ